MEKEPGELDTHEVFIGPDRFVKTSGHRFSKTQIPDELRRGIFTKDEGIPVFIHPTGEVVTNNRTIGFLGQNDF